MLTFGQCFLYQRQLKIYWDVSFSFLWLQNVHFSFKWKKLSKFQNETEGNFRDIRAFSCALTINQNDQIELAARHRTLNVMEFIWNYSRGNFLMMWTTLFCRIVFRFFFFYLNFCYCPLLQTNFKINSNYPEVENNSISEI